MQNRLVLHQTCENEIHKYVIDECKTLDTAKKYMNDAGYELEYITSGSTPTFSEAVKDKNINVLHPGNYVFLDSIQLSIKKAEIIECLKEIGASKKNYLLFSRYMEALIAFHKYYGGKEQ